jgi:hypothetical protein
MPSSTDARALPLADFLQTTAFAKEPTAAHLFQQDITPYVQG